MRITTGRVVAATLVILLVAAAAVTVFLGIRFFDDRATENARNSSLDAAKGYATTMFGYTPQNVDQHIAESKSVLTGAAKPTYDDLVTKNNLAAEVRKQGVVSAVTIQDAGVVTNTQDTSKVLIFMNQSVTRNNKELVRVDPSRLTFSMVKQGDRWMINGIDVITDDSFRSRVEQTDTPPPGAVPMPTSKDPSSATPSASPAPSAPPAG
ncbi:hypothetical protein [Gordonia hankookensis]|uniref:Mce-associated membrane protein n=1 Tax=Gordonia hankookensis TaxID=589403 RepID=A0ABR7W9D1_9ACTN|nr:hypothetical protein [Gordonia hankookensis]MBD1319156.1 hypothetical protein [Gordonia hankookensis]